MSAVRKVCGLVLALLLVAVPAAATAGVRASRLQQTTAPAFDPHAEGLIPIGEGPDRVPFKSRVSTASITGRNSVSGRVASSVNAVTGTAQVPVALVDFSDHPAERTLHSSAAYDAMLFQDGYPHGAGSMRDFYQDQSGGLFDVEGTVSPWKVLPKSLATYAGDNYGLNDTAPNGRTMAYDAAAATDEYFDFCKNDFDGDGFVDTFFVVHAGPGAEATSSYSPETKAIWSHQSQIYPRYVSDDTCANGKTMKVGTYVTMPEEVLSSDWGTPGAPDRLTPIGVFVHEYGHALGLPDLYDVDYSSHGGVGTWDAMAGGGYGFNGVTEWRPTPFSAWTKTQLGWAIPQTVTQSLLATAIPSADLPREGAFTGVYKLVPPGSNGDEYFLVENRTPNGWAADFPGSGLLVWHIDDSRASDMNEDNADDDHRRVELLQADGLGELGFAYEDGRGLGDRGDMFPGASNKTTLSDSTNPSTRLYSGAASGISLTDIGLGGVATLANLNVPTAADPGTVPEPEPVEPSQFAPDELFVNKGTQVGALTTLAADDGVGVKVKSVLKRSRYVVDYDLYFTVDPSVSSFDVTFDSFRRTKAIFWVYNWADARYETLTTLRTIDPGAPLTLSLDGAGYVSPDGYVDIGLTRKATRAFGHHLDHVSLTPTG